jgi:uncharacterized protein (TIGR02265 family)
MQSTPLRAPPARPQRRAGLFTAATLFEALFVHGLAASGPFAAELKAAGFDLDDIELEYELAVFHACVDVAHRHAFPHLTRPQSRFQLGRAFVRGFVQTRVGRVVSAGLPAMGPVRYLKRFPDHLRVDALPIYATPVVLGEREVRMEFRTGTKLSPDFFAGVLEEGLRLSRAQDPQLKVARADDAGFDVVATWR